MNLVARATLSPPPVQQHYAAVGREPMIEPGQKRWPLVVSSLASVWRMWVDHYQCVALSKNEFKMLWPHPTLSGGHFSIQTLCSGQGGCLTYASNSELGPALCPFAQLHFCCKTKKTGRAKAEEYEDWHFLESILCNSHICGKCGDLIKSKGRVLLGVYVCIHSWLGPLM